MEPFDDPPKPPRRSARLNPEDSNEPLILLRRQKQSVEETEPLWKDMEQDFMAHMELNDPWEPEQDPWAIQEITAHRDSPKVKSHKKLLVTYQCDN